MKLPKIAIVGGGPGGLTLARLLQVQNIPCSLYELEKSRKSRSQGGSLDIHQHTGQRVLKEAGLYSAFRNHAREEGEALKILDKHGAAVFEDDGSDGPQKRPEIDRNILRTILLDSLEKDTIKWGKKVVSVAEGPMSTSSNPKFEMQFEDGDVEKDFDLVVGADGAWSRVRNLLTDTKAFYSGITCVEARADNADSKHPDLSRRVGNGSCFQFGDRNGLLSQRNGDGSVRTYAMVRVPEDWSLTCGIDWSDNKRSKEELIETMYKSWDPLGKRLILQSDDSLIVRPLYMLPLEVRWPTRPGVTMIGDAAHLMTPFAGVGVNLALADALDLSHAIRSHVEQKVDWKTSLNGFEEKMLMRAAKEANATLSNLNVMFSGNDATEIARKLGEHMAGAGESDV